MKNYSKLFLAAAFAIFLSSCETPDDNAIQQARACVDAAGRLDAVSPAQAEGASGAAAQCEAMVANMTSPESGRVGFGAVLIENGLLTKITQMTTAMQQSGNNQSQITASMQYIALATTSAAHLLTYAARSGSNGAIKLAEFIQFASVVNTVAPITSPAQATTDLQNLANTATTTPNDPTVVSAGTAAIQAQQQACAGSGTTTSMCTQLTAAIGSATTPAQAITNIYAYVNGGGH